MFKIILSKDRLAKKFNKPRSKRMIKWIIKSHLDSGRRYYTQDAWDYLIDLARQEGFSDAEIASIISKDKDLTYKDYIMQMLLVAVVGALCVFVLPALFDINKKLGIFSSILLTAFCVWYLWKKRW